MRSFFLFVALLAVSLILAAAVTYPAWLLVGLISVEPIHRVMHRVAMLLALIGLFALTRRLRLTDRESLGFGVPRPTFLRRLLLGWLAGLALMTPLIATLMGLDIREGRAEMPALVTLVLSGIVSGLTIALIEETFFRGVLYSAVARTSGTIAAIVAPSALYACVHFLGGRLRVPAEDVRWQHGFEVLAKLFERYADPLGLADSWLALFMLGVLLSLVRMRTGSIAASMGLHAAGVAAIAVLRELTLVNEAAPTAFLVGNYDGVLGWAALCWFGVIATAYALTTRPKHAASGTDLPDTRH
jgi:uncharacterized protein